MAARNVSVTLRNIFDAALGARAMTCSTTSRSSSTRRVAGAGEAGTPSDSGALVPLHRQRPAGGRFLSGR